MANNNTSIPTVSQLPPRAASRMLSCAAAKTWVSRANFGIRGSSASSQRAPQRKCGSNIRAQKRRGRLCCGRMTRLDILSRRCRSWTDVEKTHEQCIAGVGQHRYCRTRHCTYNLVLYTRHSKSIEATKDSLGQACPMYPIPLLTCYNQRPICHAVVNALNTSTTIPGIRILTISILVTGAARSSWGGVFAVCERILSPLSCLLTLPVPRHPPTTRATT